MKYCDSNINWDYMICYDQITEFDRIIGPSYIKISGRIINYI